MILFAFDRDDTVDTGGGPIPLWLVRFLEKHTSHEVWAIGNQLLAQEANIAGVKEILELTFVTPHWEKVICSNDPTIALETKTTRLNAIRKMVNYAERYIVTDNIDLSQAPGWEHYYPDDFMSGDWI